MQTQHICANKLYTMYAYRDVDYCDVDYEKPCFVELFQKYYTYKHEI